MSRRLRALALALVVAALLVVGSGSAGAHVSVLPAQVTQNEAQEFTIRVPVERNLATTAVSVDFPKEIVVYSFGPAPTGWKATPRLGDDGLFAGVDFTGGRIPPNGYLDFTVLGTPFETGTAIFPARQTYADGKVKPWTDPAAEEEGAAESGPTDRGPAARVEVVAPGEATGPAAPGPAAPAAGESDSSAGIWLGVIAIAISALALLAVGLLWSTRPARLPEDD